MRHTSDHARRRQVISAILGLILLLPTVPGCDYHTMKKGNPVDPGGDTLAVKVTLAPPQTILPTGETKLFLAAVTGSTNRNIAWSIASGAGSVDTNGLYTAPDSIAVDTLRVTVKAASVAEPRAFATAVVSVIRGTSSGDCDTTGVTFGGTVVPILRDNCLVCHSGPTPPKGIRLDTYEAVRKQAVSGKLYGVISHSPGFVKMPYASYGGSIKLPECSIAKIKAWIDRGSRND